MPSTHDSILTQFKAQVQALSLSGITTSVYLFLLPSDRQKETITIPAAVIAVPPISEAIAPGTLLSEDTEYPVGVYFVEPADQGDLTTNRARWLEWRETVREHFHHRPSTINSTVTSCYDIVVSPGPIISPAHFFSENLRVGWIHFRVICRQLRN